MHIYLIIFHNLICNQLFNYLEQICFLNLVKHDININIIYNIVYRFKNKLRQNKKI